MSDENLRHLLTPQGWQLLDALPPYDPDTVLPLAESLRAKGLPADLVAAAITQSKLRAKAETKFGPFAAGMLFTQDGLEQATRLSVAARHAQRYQRASLTQVADLGCGIGGDAMAFAGLDLNVLAVEKDETTAALATVNLRHWPNATVRHADATTVAETDYESAYLDPARRDASGNRVHDPRRAQPPLSFVLDLAKRKPVGVKLAPAVQHSLLPPHAESQWVSVDGDVVEAGLWFGPLAREGVHRSALLLRSHTDGAVVVDDADMPYPEVHDPGRYLIEPDGAVIRAGLVGQVAAQVDGHLLDRTIAYVSTDQRPTTALGTSYAVIDVMPFGLKTLRSYLRERGVGSLTIKKRGTAVEPEGLRTQLRLKGPQSATIVLTRLKGHHSILVVEPL